VSRQVVAGWALALALLMLALPAAASAKARAWLDRDRIALGETVQLNVESTAAAAPDYAPLLGDFDLSGHSSRQQFEWTGAGMQARSTYAVSLRPRRAGQLRIPALRVGGQSTAPLMLSVAQSMGAAPAAAGREVFIESVADDADPYVQQTVGWVVRLYSALPLVSGRLDQDAPPGATLQRVGDDAQYRRSLGSRSYTVVERRYQLIPERSGALAIPPARFEGRAVGGVFDRLFGDGQVDLRARAAPRVLQVRPIPVDAPQPWLPLHSLALQYVTRPQRLRVGSASTLEVEMRADGASGVQMPALELPATAGVEVFAEPPRVEESIVDGRPRVRIRRRFSIVPSQAGSLELPGPRIEWWDVGASRARVAQLPPIELVAAPGSAVPAAAPVAADGPGIPAPPSTRLRRTGFMVALGLALALCAYAAYRMRRSGFATRGASKPDPDPYAPTAGPAVSLARLLELGDLGDIEAALRAAAPDGTRDLDDVVRALDDEAQRAAVLALGRRRSGARARPAAGGVRTRPGMAHAAPGAAGGAAPAVSARLSRRGARRLLSSRARSGDH
jgi:hypothetical protein